MKVGRKKGFFVWCIIETWFKLTMQYSNQHKHLDSPISLYTLLKHSWHRPTPSLFFLSVIVKVKLKSDGFVWACLSDWRIGWSAHWSVLLWLDPVVIVESDIGILQARLLFLTLTLCDSSCIESFFFSGHQPLRLRMIFLQQDTAVRLLVVQCWRCD